MAVILGYTKWYELSLSYVSVTVWLKIIEIARRRHRIFSVSGDNAKISKYNAADKASWDATAAGLLKLIFDFNALTITVNLAKWTLLVNVKASRHF